MRSAENFSYEDKKSRSALMRKVGSAVLETAGPDPEFFAIWKVATTAGVEVGRDARAHLRKMGALQLLLITNQQDRQNRSSAHWRAIEQHFGIELSIARDFDEGLKNMPKPWQAALKDVLSLRKDKEGVEYS